MGERLQSQKSYICSFFDCKAKFSKLWKLEAHLCKHTGLRPFSCENCDKSFCTRYQLTRHQLNHSGDRPHKCLAEGCSEDFVTHSSMKNHMARLHQQQEKYYKCDHQGCGKDFTKKSQLNAHRCEHTQLLPFHCSFNGCTREFPSHGKMKCHEKVHQGYPCQEDNCPFQGKTWTEYQKHRKEHRIKLQCDDCKKLFVDAWFLRQHRRRVHSGMNRLFRCPKDGCDKTFTQHFNLESHVLGDHEGKKMFSCAHPGCGRSFTMKESLWRHGVVHDPAKEKLQKLRPRKNQPWRQAQQLKAAAASTEACRLATRLANTKLVDTNP
ncbi:general transcription factor IIIA, b [Polymixia lowei]